MPPKFSLVYGTHLEQLISRGVVVKILFKQSHVFYKVQYQKAIDDLSDDKIEDNKIKTTFTNIALGLQTSLVTEKV